MFDPIAYINEPRWQQTRLGLDRVADLLDRMGRPQDRLKFVHVAGTNGKGSTCAYLASMLQQAGYRTGLFTSPYIIEFAERIRVNGVNIPHEDLVAVTLFVREHAEALAEQTGEHPTEFELMTAVAFEHFARSGCDIVVCEVGLGGRLDSTNIIAAPEACVIARLGLDHTAFLGDTLPQVAREKAGIIKEGSPVVSWPQEPEAQAVINEVAAEQGCSVVMPDFDELVVQDAAGVVSERVFWYRGERYTTKLLGRYQPSNAALAIEVARVLQARGWDVSDDCVKQGIAQTSWPGRFEVVAAGPPLVIVDGGHNPQGAAVLAESLRDVCAGKRVTFVFSVLADKEYPAMIEAVAPLAKAFVCATPPNPRALPGADLAREVRTAVASDVEVYVADGFEQAFVQARAVAGHDGVICAFGSLYSICDIKQACECVFG